MNAFKILNLSLVLCLSTLCVYSQENNLFNQLDSITPKGVQYTYGTFKSTRVLNGHSNERMPQGQLDVRFEHRFGLMNQGYYQFFGLDQSSTLISLEYGIKDWIMVGLNRTSIDKTVSGFTKFSILRQSTGAIEMPVSLSLLLETSVIGIKWPDPTRDNLFSSRISYIGQLIIARKFNENLSLQLAPIWIHRNLVSAVIDKNDQFALGMASRYKISRRSSINIEYYPVFGSSWDHSRSYKNALAVGFDIETGGHVFQLILSNTQGMIEKNFITETTGNWLKGDLHLGFNISRVFSLK
ncbi:MAG TPA: DUF5777 family beta-barrel protein [Paludibacter sp.]|nr:DUF5777 family beta-barrel protein [Paludibacter sp.]